MNKPLLTFTLLILAFGLSTSLFAQESGFPTEETERPAESQYPAEENYNVREGGMMLPEERTTVTPEKKADSPILQGQAKQTVLRTKPIKPADTRKQDSQVEGENDDSVLSFNFLYYLIQKFKFDTVE